MDGDTIVSRDVQQYNETIPLDHISISGNNPREKVEDEEFEGLKKDLAANGLINPILVRPIGNPDASRYEIVCGHRRLEAAKQLGWPEIRCTVRSMTDEEAFDLMGVENIQRQNLSPVEELRWLQKAVRNAEGRGEKQGEFARRIGKTPSWVSNKLRVANAPQEVLDLYAQGKLGDKHVLVLLSYRPYEALFAYLMRIVSSLLSNGRAVSASQIEDEARHLIRLGGGEDYALCLDPFPYENRHLQPYFNQDCGCNPGECNRVKVIEVEGIPRPYCLDKECWTKRLDGARKLYEGPAAGEYEAMQESARSADVEKEIEAQDVELAQGHKCIVEGCQHYAGRGNTFCSEHGPEDMGNGSQEDSGSDEDPEFVKARGTGRCLQCGEWNEASGCTFNCICHEECDDCFSPVDEKPDLPVKQEGPEPTVFVCRICGARFIMLDKAGATSDMIAHLFENSEKARHNKAIQKFVSGLLNGGGVEELIRFFETAPKEPEKIPAEAPKPLEPEPERYYECSSKNRGANARTMEEARTILNCDKCRIKVCPGPEADQ